MTGISLNTVYALMEDKDMFIVHPEVLLSLCYLCQMYVC